jgi:hypothetical protein
MAAGTPSASTILPAIVKQGCPFQPLYDDQGIPHPGVRMVFFNQIDKHCRIVTG